MTHDSPSSENAVPSPDSIAIERTATAWHEAGHAVMALALGRPIQKVTIASAQQPAGGTRLGACKIQKGRFKPSDDWLEDEVLILLAGMVAHQDRTPDRAQLPIADYGLPWKRPSDRGYTKRCVLFSPGLPAQCRIRRSIGQRFSLLIHSEHFQG